jgi:hypothetical protein
VHVAQQRASKGQPTKGAARKVNETETGVPENLLLTHIPTGWYVS